MIEQSTTLSQQHLLCPRIVGDDAFLLVRVIAGDQGFGRFGGTQVDRLVRHIRRDEDEVARFVDDRLAQTRPIAGFDPSFQQVDGGVIAASPPSTQMQYCWIMLVK